MVEAGWGGVVGVGLTEELRIDSETKAVGR